MGLFNWIRTQVYGVDVDAEQARGEALDAAIAAENRKDADKYGPNWYSTTEENLEASRQDIHAQVDEAYYEGMAEGAENIADVVAAPFEVAGKGLGAVSWGFIKGGWWLILAALAFVWLVYLGGWQKLARKLK